MVAAKRETEAPGQLRDLYNGPEILESDGFIRKCTELLLKRFRSPLVSESKYKLDNVIDRSGSVSPSLIKTKLETK